MKKNYPVKQDLNLAQRERKHRDLETAAFVGILLVVVIGLFCKFAVLDQLWLVSRAESSAVQTEQMLSQAQLRTVDYDAVRKEYESYALAQSTLGGDANIAECLNLLEQQLMQKSRVSSFTAADGLIAVQLSGVTLQEISNIYVSLTDVYKRQTLTCACPRSPPSTVKSLSSACWKRTPTF